MFKESIYGTINQIGTYLVPLISIPILFKAFGMDLYSEIIFFQALLALILIFIEFGFTNYFIKNFSDAHENEMRLIFNKIITIKILTSLVLLALVFLIIFLTNRLYITSMILLCCFSHCFDSSPLAITLKKFEKYSLIMVSSKVIYIFLLIFIINDSHDLLKYIFLTVLYQFPFFLYLHKPIINIFRSDFIELIKQSYLYFVPKINQNLYLNIPVIATEYLSLSIGNAAVGIPQKIFNACSMILNPFMSLIFRNMSKVYSRIIINKVLIWLLIVYIFISLALFYFSPLIIGIIVGEELDANMLEIFRILVLFLPVAVLNMVLGNSVLLANSKNYIVIRTSFCALITCFIVLLLSNHIASEIHLVTLLVLLPKCIEAILRLIYSIKQRYVL